MAVDPGFRGVQEAEYGSTSARIVVWCDLNGVQDNPAPGATADVYRPGQVDEAPTLAAQPMTEDANHMLYLDFDASDLGTWFLGPGYRLRASWTDSTGRARKTTVTFEVVRQPLVYNCPLNKIDLEKSHSMLPEALTQEGETEGTVAQKIIMQAWTDVLAWVRSKGRRPALTTGKEGLYLPVLYRAQLLAFEFQLESGGGANDVWRELADRAAKKYEVAQEQCVLEYREADTAAARTERTWTQSRIVTAPPVRDLGYGVGPFAGRGWLP